MQIGRRKKKKKDPEKLEFLLSRWNYITPPILFLRFQDGVSLSKRFEEEKEKEGILRTSLTNVY